MIQMKNDKAGSEFDTKGGREIKIKGVIGREAKRPRGKRRKQIEHKKGETKRR